MVRAHLGIIRSIFTCIELFNGEQSKFDILKFSHYGHDVT